MQAKTLPPPTGSLPHSTSEVLWQKSMQLLVGMMEDVGRAPVWGGGWTGSLLPAEGVKPDLSAGLNSSPRLPQAGINTTDVSAGHNSLQKTFTVLIQRKTFLGYFSQKSHMILNRPRHFSHLKQFCKAILIRRTENRWESTPKIDVDHGLLRWRWQAHCHTSPNTEISQPQNWGGIIVKALWTGHPHFALDLWGPEQKTLSLF